MVLPLQWSQCEMAVDDGVNGFGIYAVARQGLRDGFGLRRDAHTLACALVALISQAGLNEDGSLARADQVAVKSLLDTVQLVGWKPFAPESFGNHAEDGAAIPPIGSGANRDDFEIAEQHPVPSAR